MAILPNPIAGFRARFLSGERGGSSPTDINNLPPGSVIAPTNPQKLDTNLALAVKNNRVGFDTTGAQRLAASVRGDRVGFDTTGAQRLAASVRGDRVGFDTTAAQRLAASVRGDRVGFDTTAAQRQSNSQATPANSSFEARLASYGLDFNPYPNPLNEYANYTYHIRWFLTSETEAYDNVNPSNPNSDKLTKTVIAESGVTAGFNIVELVIKASTTANKQKRNMWNLSEFTMIISEPLGLSLFDKIYYSAQEIGVINHTKCPYFIEVWFNGYDEDGNLAAPNLYYNMYRVMIADVQASATHVGTTYNIVFNADNHNGEVNINATPLSAVSIPCTTLAEFFDKLAVVMNQQQATVNNDGIIRTKYKFVYPDIWKNWSMRPANTDKHVNRGTDMSDDGRPNVTVIKLVKGMAIENIVNQVVYQCVDAQDWITGAGGGVAANAGTQADQALIGYVTVYASSKITGFDPVTRNYISEVTYTLFRSESLKAFTDMKSVQEAQKATTQQEKLRYLVEKKRLVKRYDYIYTGLNTEVITFDIKINMLWAFNTPSWSQGNSYYQYAIPAVANQESQDYLNAKGLVPPSFFPLDAAEARALDKALTINTALGSVPVGTNVVEAAAALTSATNRANLIRSNLPVFFDQSSGQIALNAAQAKNPVLQQFAQRTNNYINTRRNTLATKYAEDTANKVNELKAPPPLPLVAVFDTQPTAQNASQSSDQSKTEVTRDAQSFAPGTGFVGAVFGNLFDERTTEFQIIDMEIRGDPWWIPMSNMTQDLVAFKLTNNSAANAAEYFLTANEGDKASYLGGDNCFLLQFRVGVVIDETTGLAVNDSLGADFFNGIYGVQDVTNTFTHGKFTQILYASKDILSQNPVDLKPISGNSATPIDDYRAPPGQGRQQEAFRPSFRGVF
jgi:hypothetical protein